MKFSDTMQRFISAEPNYIDAPYLLKNRFFSYTIIEIYSKTMLVISASV